MHMTDLVDQQFPPINRKTAPDFTDFNFWRAPVMQFDLPDLSPPSPALSARSDSTTSRFPRLGSIASSLSRRSSRQTLGDRGTRAGSPSSPLLQATVVEEHGAHEEDDDDYEHDRSESGSMPGSLPNASDFERLRRAAGKTTEQTEAEAYKGEVLAGEEEDEDEDGEEGEGEYGVEDEGDDFGDGLDFSSVPVRFCLFRSFFPLPHTPTPTSSSVDSPTRTLADLGFVPPACSTSDASRGRSTFRTLDASCTCCTSREL